MLGSVKRTVRACGTQAKGEGAEAVIENNFSSSQDERLSEVFTEKAKDPKGANLELASARADKPGARATTTNNIEARSSASGSARESKESEPTNKLQPTIADKSINANKSAFADNGATAIVNNTTNYGAQTEEEKKKRERGSEERPSCRVESRLPGGC